MYTHTVSILGFHLTWSKNSTWHTSSKLSPWNAFFIWFLHLIFFLSLWLLLTGLLCSFPSTSSICKRWNDCPSLVSFSSSSICPSRPWCSHPRLSMSPSCCPHPSSHLQPTPLPELQTCMSNTYSPLPLVEQVFKKGEFFPHFFQGRKLYFKTFLTYLADLSWIPTFPYI